MNNEHSLESVSFLRMIKTSDYRTIIVRLILSLEIRCHSLLSCVPAKEREMEYDVSCVQPKLFYVCDRSKFNSKTLREINQYSFEFNPNL